MAVNEPWLIIIHTCHEDTQLAYPANDEEAHQMFSSLVQESLAWEGPDEHIVDVNMSRRQVTSRYSRGDQQEHRRALSDVRSATRLSRTSNTRSRPDIHQGVRPYPCPDRADYAHHERSTMTETFTHWLLRQKHRQDATGDVARDFAADRSMGCAKYIRSPNSVWNHLVAKHDACDEALDALNEAIAEWQEAS